MSPDWSAKVEPVPYAKLGDPQSLNLYAYMLNNPLGGVDQDGHCGNRVDEESCANAGAAAVTAGVSGVALASVAVSSPAQQQSVSAGLQEFKKEIVSAFTTEEGFKKYIEDNPAAMVMGGPAGEEAAVAKEGEQLLTRYGTKVESTLEKLSGDAAKALDKIGIHGVSTTSIPKPTLPSGSALMSDVQKAFNIFKTGGPGHFTVELPKPVTDSVVQIFNSLFFK